MEPFQAFWGKARPCKTALHSFHPLFAHGLDVAAVGNELIRVRPHVFAWIASQLEWTIEEFRAFWLHFLALHDIGKFSPLFQIKMPELYRVILPQLSEEITKIVDPGHPYVGYALVQSWLSGDGKKPDAPERFSLFKDRQKPGTVKSLLNPIFGHHGRPLNSVKPHDLTRYFHPPESYRAACAFKKVIDLLLPTPQLSQPSPSRCSAVSWALAGLTALADWIGSDQAWFSYIGHSAFTPEAYWEVTQSQAREAIAEARLLPALPAPLKSFASLTGITMPPTEAQNWASQTKLPEGPILALLEDVTGGGKSEAAFMLAHRLMSEGRATGLYFALPTMATANAMFDRISKIKERFYTEEHDPSLTLGHSRAGLHPFFRKGEANADKQGESHPLQANTSETTILFEDWLMGEGRRALFADFGVGTIDQALLGVLPTRYQCIRLAGLAGKVLIIDEVHSYDAYVGTELNRLIAFHALLGGSTIVLSATLPGQIKKRIIADWQKAVSHQGEIPQLGNHYPCAVTIGAGSHPLETSLQARADLRRSFTLTRVPDMKSALERLDAAVAAGACVAIIRNTVDDAIETAEFLREKNIDVELFHARFAMGDRLAIEKRVLHRFDKRSSNEDRRGKVVVATQVIEQSLDIDFDLIISDLAPIDLILQRLGRLWRHTERLRPIPGPELIVISPDPALCIDANWAKDAFPRASAVYRNHSILWRSAREIVSHPILCVPEDVRAIIEAVYCEKDEDIPEPLLQNRIAAQGNAGAERAFAEVNLLDPTSGYYLDNQAWLNETKIQTRLVEEGRVLRLARFDNNALVPWHFDPDIDLAWSLSEVTAYERKLQGRYETRPQFEILIQKARSLWSRFDEHIILLPLIEEPKGCWKGELKDPADNKPALTISYSTDKGLSFETPT